MFCLRKYNIFIASWQNSIADVYASLLSFSLFLVGEGMEEEEWLAEAEGEAEVVVPRVLVLLIG